MQCPNCNAPVDDHTAFCGNCGKQIAPLQAKGATAGYPEGLGDDLPTILTNDPSRNRQYAGEGPAPQTPGAYRDVYQQGGFPNMPYIPTSDRPKPLDTPAPPAPPRRNNLRRTPLFVAIFLVLLAAIITGAIVLFRGGPTPPPTPPVVSTNATGQAVFFDSQNSTGHTDALKVTINALKAPPSGSQYDAWLVNDQNEQVVALGQLVAQGGSFILPGDSHHTNLLGAGNKLEITQEQGNVTLPTGKVILSGTFPPLAFIHIRHLLVGFPITPGKIGLLVGLQNQTRLLDSQALLLGNIAASGNTAAIQCAAQSILDIIEGAHGSHFQQLANQCASLNIITTGDGFGIIGTNGYAALAAVHASLAATQSDATDNIRLHAGQVEIATNNIKEWATTVDQDALNLLNNPGNTAKVQEIVTLSDRAFHGVDKDGDGSIDPVSGEAGVTQGYNYGQLMANLPLVSAS
jgi:Anti-sigma-K factor rskA